MKKIARWFLIFILIAISPCSIHAEEWNLKKIQEIFMTRPPWVDNFWVREDTDIDITNSICANLKYFYNFSGAFAAVAERENLHWRDVKIMTADVALHILSEQSSYVAKLLVRVFNLPYEIRKNTAPCGSIIPHWDDSMLLASVSLHVLSSGFNSPLSIGMTGIDLQEKMLDDIHATLKRLATKALLDPSTVSEFKKYIIRAIETCKVSSRDLTQQERIEWGLILQSLPAEFWQD